jgi:chromosome segregation protein
LRARGVELAAAEAEVKQARAARAEIEVRLQAVIERRGKAERALAERAERHDALARRVYEARSAHERLGLRSEQVGASGQALARRIERVGLELSEIGQRALNEAEAETRGAGSVPARPEHGAVAEGSEERIGALEVELAELESRREREIELEIEGLESAREREAARVSELEEELADARAARGRADELVEKAREGSVWSITWDEVRRVIVAGVERVLAQRQESERLVAAGEVAAHAERVARGVVEYALKGVRAAEEAREQTEAAMREAERRLAEGAEAQRRTEWLIEQRRAAPQQGPLAVRKAQLEGELTAERRQAERVAREAAERGARVERLRAQHAADVALAPVAERLAVALQRAGEVLQGRMTGLQEQLAGDREAGEEMAGELRACAGEEAEIQTALRGAGEVVTGAEVGAQRVRDQAQEAELQAQTVAGLLELSEETSAEQAPALEEEQVGALAARVERLQRRREQLGPVNPLAQEEYAEAVAHVEELEGRRADLETALRELKAVIRETDRQIHEMFEQTFAAAARNFEELAGDVFPGGSGRLRLVRDEQTPRTVLGGQPLSPDGAAQERRGGGDDGGEEAAEAAAEAEAEREDLMEDELLGVEIEITPAGKSAKRLSLLSGGEKSMTALAFLFAVFLARPCPFYILDEVEAALDDLNLDRFLALLRRYADRAQFIVITHQKRTMEAADWLFGVSMGGDGVSKVLSRRLPAEEDTPPTNIPPASTPQVAEVA